MTVVQTHGLGRRIAGRWVLRDVELAIKAGSLTCVVGPSGSGKSTLLRLLAGLDAPDEGEIVSPVGPTPVCALVAQRDVLFPELTARENIALALSGARLPRARVDEAVDVMLLRLGLDDCQHRLPAALSGGQARRVSIARALLPGPRVLLLDEPSAGLDATLREQLAQQLRGLRRRLNVAIVQVTHDQNEALAASDQLVVLHSGRVAQAGPPQQVYARPQDLFTAQFLGRSTFLDVSLLALAGRDGQRIATIEVLGSTQRVSSHDAVVRGRGTSASLLVRPHDLELSLHAGRRRGEATGPFGLVLDTFFRGDHLEHVVETAQGTVLVAGPLDLTLPVDSSVEVRLRPGHGWLLPASTG